MGADQIVELFRATLREAMLLAAPILLTATIVSLIVSVLQTLTSLQDQTLSTVPRVIAAGIVALLGLPWFLSRLTAFTLNMLSDMHRLVR